MKHLRMIRSLRLNYTWHGTWRVFRSRDVRIPGNPPLRAPGWVLMVCCPTAVHNWMQAAADGVFV